MLFPSFSGTKLIGAYTTGAAFMKGFIDDIRIYNRALSANEITNIYNQTKSKYQ